MTSSGNNQFLQTFIPVYDVVPEEWEDARPFFVEQLKKVTNAVNVREVGWYLNQEVLAGKTFIPGIPQAYNSNITPFRQVYRVVVDFGALVIGVNSKPHGVIVNSSFRLVQLYGGATNATAMTGEPLPNGSDTMTYDATNINITVAAAYTQGFAVMEYLLQL